MFRRWDLNQNGQLCPDELLEARRRNEVPFEPRQLYEFFMASDGNQDRVLDEQEFLHMNQPVQTPRPSVHSTATPAVECVTSSPPSLR